MWEVDIIKRMIAGLEETNSGQNINWWRRSKLINYPPKENEILPWFFNHYALYPHMTVFQSLQLWHLEINFEIREKDLKMKLKIER